MNKYNMTKWGSLVALVVVTVFLLVFGRNATQEAEEQTITVVEAEGKEREQEIQPVSEAAVQEEEESSGTSEQEVYSFLQGPKSWKQRREWSGKWGKEYHDGSSFGAFGCGFCAMANIYSTLTKYQCTPIDIYQWTKRHTSYGGGGAVAWSFMRKAMSELGFMVTLGEKPSTYEMFREKMAAAQSMLVLVSSYNDDSYWKDTPGHYVTLFLYNSEMEEVFLTDSGDPDHNRHWVPLKTIYKALKTSSDFQYMSVEAYDEGKDTWKHTKAEGMWVKPDGTK